jgi:phage terminase small subunit
MTPKQQRFVEEYLIDLNAKHAAIRAGYAAKTAEQQGYQLLQHPSVAAAVADRIEQRSEQTGIDAAWVLQKAVILHEKAMAEGAYAPAKGALELIGKHINVQAFREQHEHRLAMTADEARTIIAALGAKYLRTFADDAMSHPKPIGRQP